MTSTGTTHSRSVVPGLATIVGFLVCVEIASGILQGYYTPIFSDIADHLSLQDADVNWLEAAQLVVSALVVPVLARLGDRGLDEPERVVVDRGDRTGLALLHDVDVHLLVGDHPVQVGDHVGHGVADHHADIDAGPGRRRDHVERG